jgi:hypothetical protein
VFPTVEKHRNAIIDYSVRNRVENLRSSCPGMTRPGSGLTVQRAAHGTCMLCSMDTDMHIVWADTNTRIQHFSKENEMQIHFSIF